MGLNMTADGRTASKGEQLRPSFILNALPALREQLGDGSPRACVGWGDSLHEMRE